MTEFIPAVLEQDVATLEARMAELSGLAQRAQVDFADNSLVPNQTVLPADFPTHPANLELDAHLMVSEPTQYFVRLAELGFRRAIIHRELPQPLEDLVAAARQAQLQLGLALNPDTDLDMLAVDLSAFSFIQLMGVHPGFGGQEFIPETINRVKQVRQLFPSMPIAVDGGVRLTNANELLAAGANWLVVGKAGFTDNGSVEAGISKWQNLISTSPPAS